MFLDVNDFAADTPWLHSPVLDYATYGVVLFAALLLAGGWLARRQASVTRKAAALWTPVGMLLALLINQPIASAVDEHRPYATLSHVLVLAHRSTDPSFPSDHAVMAGAVTAGLFLVSWRLGAAALTAALALAFARVYIGAHYPRDVVTGLVLGAVVCLVSFVLVRPLLIRLIGRAEHSALRPLFVPTRGAFPR